MTTVLATPDWRQPAGPCDIVSKATITLLGQAGPAGEPSGPEKEEDSDGMVSHCWYRAGAVMVIVSEVTSTSAANAKHTMNAEYISRKWRRQSQRGKEKGVGGGGFWATTEKAAQYALLKGGSCGCRRARWQPFEAQDLAS